MGDMMWLQLQGTAAKLVASPMIAVSKMPYWLGFAGLEYFSDWLQTATEETFSDPTFKRLFQSVVRGGILTTNLSYWGDEGSRNSSAAQDTANAILANPLTYIGGYGG